MQQSSFKYLVFTVLLIAVSGQEELRKLVCSQPDGSLEGPRGYCAFVDRQCQCTSDCTEASVVKCVCERSDLAYARDQGLAECSIYTEEEWYKYVTSSRSSKDYQQLPPASNTPDGKGLLFSTHDQNLAWPITDPGDLDALLEHGSHCFEMVEMFNKQVSDAGKLNSLGDQLHYEHCRRLMRRVLAYYTTTKEYRVQPESLCGDLNLAAKAVGPTFAIRFRYTFTYRFRYIFFYVPWLTRGNDDVKIPNEIYNSLYNEFKQAGRSPTQKDLFDRVSGQNLGDLLFKDWLQEKLTPEEESFLARWESEQVVRAAALSVYCNQGDASAAPIDKLRQLLTNK